MVEQVEESLIRNKIKNNTIQSNQDQIYARMNKITGKGQQHNGSQNLHRVIIRNYNSKSRSGQMDVQQTEKDENFNYQHEIYYQRNDFKGYPNIIQFLIRNKIIFNVVTVSVDKNCRVLFLDYEFMNEVKKIYYKQNKIKNIKKYQNAINQNEINFNKQRKKIKSSQIHSNNGNM